MFVKLACATAAIALSVSMVHADDSIIALGKMAYSENCAVCHGSDAKGGGVMAQVLTVRPPDLTKIAERAGGPFSVPEVFDVIVMGKDTPGHGSSAMPVWGDYFFADALKEEGKSNLDAITIAAGRVLSLTYYLESIQQ